MQIETIYQKIQDIMLIDKIRIRKLLAQAKHKQDASTELLSSQIDHAISKINKRKELPLTIEYPDLPISKKKQQISDAIKKHQVVIIAGETGSGKTTQIPKICLELGYGIKGVIGHTQPRRIAARSVAQRLSEEVRSPLGDAVGYKVRFSDQSQESTLVKLMTDGILLAEIQKDPLLYQYDVIIIDEAHERSLNIDFLIGYISKILPKRPDLKIIITSATLDHERFSAYFSHAPIVEVSGRTYPVEIRYRPLDMPSTKDQIDGIIDAVDELFLEKRGDILIFLSGEKEIRDTSDALSKLNLLHTEILPLYARLSPAEQNRIFQPSIGRRIVLATNVAETSLTVPGIKYVIDTGYARISRYSVRTKVQRLPIEAISQASANQRAGRCGRVSDGICIRLYSEQDFMNRPEYTEPEILRTNLASVILQMVSLGLGDIHAFPFIQTPDKKNIQDGIRLLEELGALTSTKHHQHKLSEIGQQLAQFPIDPRLGRMIIEGKKYGCIKELLVITSALSIQDPKERPFNKQQASDEKHRRFADKSSDFISYLNLWNYIQEQKDELSSNQFRKLCVKDFLNYLRVSEWQDLYRQLRQVVKELKLPINSTPCDYSSLHMALLSGLLSHIGMKDIEKKEFTGARGIRFSIHPSSTLFKKPSKWCVVSELVDTQRLWGRIAAQIEPQWLESLAKHIVKYSYSDPHWSKKQGAVFAKEKVTLYGLPIISERNTLYSSIDPVLCRELFIRHALVEGDWQTDFKFFSKNLSLLNEAETLEHKARRRDIVVDDEVLFQFYHERIPADIVSAKHFNHWWKNEAKKNADLLDFSKTLLVKAELANNIKNEDYPDLWKQNNFKFPLSYHFEPNTINDGVTIHIPLAVLNQVKDEGFDWLVPGLLEEKIVTLIKCLPKNLRKNFVPAPNYAKAFLENQINHDVSLLDALEKQLRRMTGVTVSREEWLLNELPTYLLMNFQIEDESGKCLASGKSLCELQNTLQKQMQKTIIKNTKNDFEDVIQTTWVFGDIKPFIEQKKNNYSIKAFPALVDEKQGVKLQFFDNEYLQHEEMKKGIRRLILLNCPSPIKYLHEKLPNKAKLGLYFNPFGSVLELIDDCIHCAIDQLVENNGGYVWEQQTFENLLNIIKGELNFSVIKIAEQVEKILTLAFQINKRLKGKVDLSLALSLADIKKQMEFLIYKGFVTDTGAYQLANIYRYLQGIDKRLDKIAQDPYKDRASMLKIDHLMDEFHKIQAKLSHSYDYKKEIEHVRWMFEELRISLFAQQLGTAYPISEKRVRDALNKLKESIG